MQEQTNQENSSFYDQADGKFDRKINNGEAKKLAKENEEERESDFQDEEGLESEEGVLTKFKDDESYIHSGL